ncbi:hypothetical protein [Dokdonella sp.]|uniref:hypothetical protein n=1 Tax=Dokdonella sp. TaxID=2291710 RepID=UPI003C450771
MPVATSTPCTSAEALQRIACARLTPYVANTFKQWSQNALDGPDACANSRAGDCAACQALQKIVLMRWNETLGQRIQEAAYEALGVAPCRRSQPVESLRA